LSCPNVSGIRALPEPRMGRSQTFIEEKSRPNV